MSYDILFKDITLVTMRDEAPVLHGTCLGVKDGKIAYMGRKDPGDAKRVIDGRGKVLMPGLINAHTHLPMTLMRGYADDYDLQTWLNDYIFPVEDKLDGRAVKCGTLLGIAEAIRTGTTSVSDMYYFCDDICQAVEQSGIKANVSRSCVLFTDPIEDDFRFDTHQGCTEAAELFEKWHKADDGRIKIDMSIHAEYTSNYLLWEALSDFAREKDTGMQVHISETGSEHEQCLDRHGLTPTSVLDCHGVFDVPVTAAHCVWVEDEDIALMARRGATAVHNPVSNLKLGSGVAPVKKMMEAGLNVALGTDGVASNNNHDMFREINAAALIHKGTNTDPTCVTAWDALKMATVGGAKAQGRENECGQLVIGYDADLIMLDLSAPHMVPCHNVISNIVYSATGNDVCLTMVRGNILYEDGVWNTIDLTEVYQELANHAIPLLFGK